MTYDRPDDTFFDLEPLKPEGSYVYIWYDGELPLYIGKGVGERFRMRHSKQDGTPSRAELLRLRAQDFRVEIVEDGLSAAEARLVERALIKVVRPIGNANGW